MCMCVYVFVCVFVCACVCVCVCVCVYCCACVAHTWHINVSSAVSKRYKHSLVTLQQRAYYIKCFRLHLTPLVEEDHPSL